MIDYIDPATMCFAVGLRITELRSGTELVRRTMAEGVLGRMAQQTSEW